MRSRSWYSLTLLAGVLLLVAGTLSAEVVVKTVPWVPTNAVLPHDTWQGRSIRLKGAANLQGAGITYLWDFGDGSAAQSGAVTNMYVIEAAHTYTGPPGTIYSARLTVTNNNTGESASKAYYVAIREKTLDVEVNVAIDEGLWYLYKNVSRTTCNGVPCAYWSPGYAGLTAANVNAFEVNGHLESGDPSNPYVDVVGMGMKYLFHYLGTHNLAHTGYFNPDSNGNGIGLYVTYSYPYYQGGMVIDAIVASGTPNAIAGAGGTNVLGRRYKDIVQDMVDDHAWAQYDSPSYGGWRYSANEFPDNSVNQWAAIGLVAAERFFGAVLPPLVKTHNLNWLGYSQNPSTGVFGYTNSSPIWGPYATTPSGMVQLAMNGVGRGSPAWDRAETYMRNNFGNCCGATVAVKDYYYGMFSFVKSLLLHDSNADGVAEPIQFLKSATAGVDPIDWYAAEAALGAPTNGVARTLVNHQGADGRWWGHDYEGTMYYFENAWAIMMLHRSLFTSGSPVAVAEAVPNPGVANAPIQLTGAESYHQSAGRLIVKWEWDLDNDGTFESEGVTVTRTWPVTGTYPVKLRVTDDAAQPASATTLLNVVVAIPPLAPTALAGGPYNFCADKKPWALDGSKSFNPDDGKSFPLSNPGDRIAAWDWELNGDALYNDASGEKPDVTAYFSGKALGTYLVSLRVTDTTMASFGQPDLTDTDSAQVYLRASTDPACSCLSVIGRGKFSKVELSWTPKPGVFEYDILRRAKLTDPFIKIGSVPGTYGLYTDSGLPARTTYYYVVLQKNSAGVCESNAVTATTTAR